jgi:hypothetical protein
LATSSLSTAKPRRKKEILNESPATCTPNGSQPAHEAPNQGNYKFLRNRRLSRSISFFARLSEGRNCARRENFPSAAGSKKRSCHLTRVPNAVLLSGVECWGVWVPDRLWKILARPGRIGVTHESIVQDSSLRGGDYLIHNAAPANPAGNQGHGEIHDVKKRNEDPK